MKLAVEPVINLQHLAAVATLATHSLQSPGYPYATAVANVPDECHRPLLLVSALAEHTRNLLADPRVSLSLLAPGAVNAQAAARATLLGDAERCAADDLLVSRYLRYVPDAAQYLQLDFMFFRIRPKRLRLIAGVGKMGWLEAEDWAAVTSIALAQEQALIDSVGALTPPGIAILGIDAYGIDYQVAGVRKRHTAVGHVGGEVFDEVLLRSAVSQLS